MMATKLHITNSLHKNFQAFFFLNYYEPESKTATLTLCVANLKTNVNESAVAINVKWHMKHFLAKFLQGCKIIFGIWIKDARHDYIYI